MADLRTSSEWEVHLGILVLDPDGWDRSNLAESWSELITESEFKARAFVSTHTTDPDWGAY